MGERASGFGPRRPAGKTFLPWELHPGLARRLAQRTQRVWCGSVAGALLVPVYSPAPNFTVSALPAMPENAVAVQYWSVGVVGNADRSIALAAGQSTSD